MNACIRSKVFNSHQTRRRRLSSSGGSPHASPSRCAPMLTSILIPAPRSAHRVSPPSCRSCELSKKLAASYRRGRQRASTETETGMTNLQSLHTHQCPLTQEASSAKCRPGELEVMQSVGVGRARRSRVHERAEGEHSEDASKLGALITTGSHGSDEVIRVVGRFLPTLRSATLENRLSRQTHLKRFELK